MRKIEKKYLWTGRGAAWAVFILLLVTYWLTVAPTVSYWDCPEYVAAARWLEVGHPPGNPVWMIVERVVTMLVPDRYAALAVNMSSGLFTALAGFFLALSVFRVALWVLLRLPRRRMPATLAAAGTALTAGLAFGWCDSAWYSAVEAEVYAMSIFMTSLTLWLMCKWAGTRSRTDSWRLLVLIAYLFGLSIGIHQLNLLIIPVLAMIWAIRRNIRSVWKLAFIFLISLGAVACVLVGMMPSTIALAAEFELFFVNALGAPMLTGVAVYVVALGISLLGAIWVTRNVRARWLMALACWPALFLSGAFIISEHFLAGAIISAGIAVLLVSGANFKARRLTLAIWMLAMLLTGYSAYALIPIRGDVAAPANAAMPGNPFTFAAYQSREQYGSKPLLYGATPYSRAMLVEVVDTEGHASYPRYAVERYADVIMPLTDASRGTRIPGDRASISREDSLRNARVIASGLDGYVKTGMKLRMRTTPELDMWFPRLTSTDPADIASYGEWVGMDTSTMVRVEISEAYDSTGRAVTKMGPGGRQKSPVAYRPTYLHHLRWLATYQTGYMYWRYLLWNFAGRQNDRPSQGQVQDGNFITGIMPVDNMMLGAEDALPPEAGTENPGRNVYLLLPLILGIIGMAWLLKSRRRGMRVCAVNALLFIMTGLAITVYLNQGPGEARERDYSFLGSFLAYAVWIGFGGLAVARRFKSLWGFAVALAVTGWMCIENRDDHDRSGRMAARNVTVNLLNSLEPNAIVLVNGDNATFPLWYAQEVEGVRRDVRVINVAYLRTPRYMANMMADWRDSRRVPTTLTREDILWGACSSVKLGTGRDTLEATDALEALRESGCRSFPGRRVRLRLSPDSVIIYDLANLRGRSGRVDFSSLMIFDMIATAGARGESRPLYWLYNAGAGRQIGLRHYTTDMLYGYRIGLLTDRERDSIAEAGIRGLLPPNATGRHVYMDHIPASQISIQRAGLTGAGLRALRGGNLRLALRMAAMADSVMGADGGSYGAVILSDTVFHGRRELARLLTLCADSLERRGGQSQLTDSLRNRSEYHSREARRKSEAWARYRRALPERLRGKMAPTY